MTALPPGISLCALHDREFPSAMLCPDCVMGGEVDADLLALASVGITQRAINEHQAAFDATIERISNRLSEELRAPFRVRIERDWFNDFDDDGSQLDSGRWELVVSTRCERCKVEHGLTRPDGVTIDENLVVGVLSASIWDDRESGRGCRCVDPLDRVVDGLSVRECMERFIKFQRDERRSIVPLLNDRQLDAARAAWSAELRAKVEVGKQGGVTVSVDDDRWEP